MGFNGNFTLNATRGMTLTHATGSTLNVFDGNTVTYNGIIAESGTAALTKSGGGTLNLGGNNTFTGATTVGNGAIRMTHASALGSGSVTVDTGAALELANNIAAGSKALSLVGVGTNDGGALRNISGNNSWAGNITLAGNARINSDADSLGLSGTLTVGANTLYLGGAGNTTVSNTISGAKDTGDGVLFKNGGGTVTLLGNNSGLTGNIQLREGALEIQNANALGTGGTVYLGTANVATAARLLVDESTTRSGIFSIQNASTGGVIEVGSSKAFTITGALNQEDGTSVDTRFEKRGAGTLILAGTDSGYAGQIRISDGTLVAGTAGSLGSNVSTNNRAIDLGLDLNDDPAAKNVALLVSNGVTLGQSIYVAPNTVSSTDYTRTIGVSGASAALATQIFLGGDLTFDVGGTSLLTVTNSQTAAMITSTGGLTKTGTGTLLLRGNNFTGGFTIEAGTVGMYLNNSLGSNTGTVTINGGAIAGVGATRTNSSALVAGGNFSLGGLGNNFVQASTLNLGGAVREINALNNAELRGVVSNGGLTKAGAATLTLTASNTYTGATAVNQGVLALSGDGRLAGGTAVTVGGGTLNFGGIANTVSTFTINSGAFTNGTLTAASYALQGGTVAGNLGAGTATANSGTTALNGTLAATSLSIGGGTLTLGSASRLNGTTPAVSIASGALNLGGNESVGTFSTTGGTLGGSGTLTAANGYSLGGGTINANLGAGALTNAASTALNGTTAATTIEVTGGTLTLGSASRFTGTTPAVSVSSGANLTLGGNETIGSLAGAGTVTMGSSRTLTVGGANTATTFSGELTGASSVTKVGTGTLTLSGGSSSYSGTTTLSNGALLIGNNAALGASALQLDAGTFASDSRDGPHHHQCHDGGRERRFRSRHGRDGRFGLFQWRCDARHRCRAHPDGQPKCHHPQTDQQLAPPAWSRREPEH